MSLSQVKEEIKLSDNLRVGDEVILKTGETMVITYVNGDEVEGFNHKGWMKRPTKNAIVDITHRHFSLPIDKE